MVTILCFLFIPSSFLLQKGYFHTNCKDRKKMRNNIKETIKGRFHSGNLCTGISSISRAFRRDPRSTGTNPIERINPLTSSLAE